MRSSKWHAHGNVYLVSERPDLTAELVREEAAGTDGILQVLASGADWAEIVIWNTDGSTAELSGNGTRIAAAWLAGRTGADEVEIRVGPRVVRARMLGGGVVEQDLGAVEVGPRETVDGIELTPVSVGNPHAVVAGDPDDIGRIGPLLETHPRFPGRTNVQVARVDGPGRVTARVWERGVGETSASGTSAIAVAAATHAAGEVTVSFPGGDLVVLLQCGRAFLTGPAVELSGPVVVVDYDPAWPAEFERLRRRVLAVLGDLALRVEHVGSTAVPGLAAKPVIDLDVVVRTEADGEAAIGPLAGLGYAQLGDLGIAGREAFAWPAGEPRHHLYVCVEGTAALGRHLAFRDYLRAHPEAVREYAELKREAALRFRDDRDAYVEAKNDFVARALAAAAGE